MKKKYLSGLIILITAILVMYMIGNSREENIDYTLVENTQNEDISELDIENFLNEIEESENKDIKVPQSETENFDVNKESLEENKEKINETNKTEQKKDYEKKESNNEEIESYELEEKESKSVFKVDKNLIMENLSFKEKKNLTKIITSLSMNDYALIIESVKNDGELECITKINSILEARLRKEEYEVVREILEPYINLEIL